MRWKLHVQFDERAGRRVSAKLTRPGPTQSGAASTAQRWRCSVRASLQLGRVVEGKCGE